MEFYLSYCLDEAKHRILLVLFLDEGKHGILLVLLF